MFSLLSAVGRPGSALSAMRFAPSDAHERTSKKTLRKPLPTRPLLVLVMGVAGSGKTTLAQEILRHLSAVYLDNNQIADAFFPDTRNGTAYAKLRPRIYSALYTVTEENLRLGNWVLLDAPHVKEMQCPEWRSFIKRMVVRTKAKMIVIRCFCSERVLSARIRARGEPRDNWKLDHWQEFLKKEPIEVPIPFRHLNIDTAKPLTKNTQAALRYILEQGA